MMAHASTTDDLTNKLWQQELNKYLLSLNSPTLKIHSVPNIFEPITANGAADCMKAAVSSAQPANLLVPGQFIRHYTGKDWVKGYGTFIATDSLISCVVGLRRELNKLITVDPIRCRYVGATGDVVIGRISEVENQRWKVDVGAQKGATLKLSAVNLPSGEQRRKTVQDQEYMRSHLKVNDLILAEVQQSSESGLFLLTRSDKFGKLGEGVLEKVHCSLISKQVSYVHVFNDLGIQVVIGRNGWIFISPTPKEADKSIAIVAGESASILEQQQQSVHDGLDADSSRTTVIRFCEPSVHQNVVRMRQIIRILARNSIPLSEYSLLTAFNISLQVPNISSLLNAEVAEKVFNEFCSLAVETPVATEYEP